MKNLFAVLFLLISVNAFSQNGDTSIHFLKGPFSADYGSFNNSEESDYFRVGVYGGSYINGHMNIVEKEKYFNSVAIEAEYVKLKNLSFYIRGLYEITQDYRNLSSEYTYMDKPSTYRVAVSFGARYYLRDKNIRPYFQLGLNHETNYRSSYSYYHTDPENYYYYYEHAEWSYFYSLNFGVGLDIKIFKKLSADIKYDLYRIYMGQESMFDTFSVLAGVKYNLIF